jgi:hypothetical protein
MTEQENDILNAVFKIGEAQGLLSRHRKTEPERAADVYRRMIEVGQVGLALIDRDASKPTESGQ